MLKKSSIFYAEKIMHFPCWKMYPFFDADKFIHLSMLKINHFSYPEKLYASIFQAYKVVASNQVP